MALTRVAPAGIGSTPGTGYVIGDSFLHSRGLNAIDGNYTGIVTAQSLRVIGDLEVEGTTTTLDTALTEVDKLEVGANNNTVGVAITQSGTGDIFNLYDGSSEVFSVADGGTVTASGDISIADKIIHTGDANTAIRFPAADTFTVETNGSERLRIKSDGKVGIGTDNPAHNLEVMGSFPDFVITDSDTTNDKFRILHNGGGTQLLVDPNNVGPNASYLIVGIDGSERLRIDSSGKIGINETNPGTLLEIKGESSKEATVTFNRSPVQSTNDGVIGELLFENATDSVALFAVKRESAADDAYFQFATQSAGGGLTERVRITSAGDMGLGTATPTSFGPTFQVAGTDPALLLQDTATAVDYFGMNIASGAVNTWFDDASAFVIHTATGLSGSGLVERLRIKSDGLLDVSGGIQVSENVTPTSGAGLELFREGNGGGQVQAYDRGGSAWLPLILKGSTQIFHTNGSERLRIKSDGQIGMGIASPTQESGIGLHIRGANGGQSRIHLTNSATGDTATDGFYIISQGAESGSASGEVMLQQKENAALKFATTNVERLRIAGNGQVLVGNYATHGAIHGNLEVNGNDGINISNATRTGTNGVQWRLIPHNGGGSSTNLRLYEGTGATEVLNVTKTGKIGIGQVDPQGDLHIGNISGNKDLIMHSANNGTATLRFREGGSIGSGYNEYSIGMVGNRNAMTVNGQGAGEIISILGDTGRIGINRQSPSFMLDIIGNSSTGANAIRIVDGAETGHGSHPSKIVAGGTYYQEMQMHGRRFAVHTYDGSSIAERFRVHHDGNVGVNCTPLAKLQVKAGTNANIALTTMSSEAAIEAFNDAGSANVPLRLRGQSLKLYTNSSERFRINSNGSTVISNAGTFPTSTNETLNVQGEGHNGHGTSNTRSIFNVTAAITSNTSGAGLWIGARTNENTAVIGTRTSSGNLAIETYNGGWGERLRVKSDGKVGIGLVTPESKVQIRDTTTHGKDTYATANTGGSQTPPTGTFRWDNVTPVAGHGRGYSAWVQSGDAYPNASNYIDVLIRNAAFYRITLKRSHSSAEASVCQMMVYGLANNANTFYPVIHMHGATASGTSTATIQSGNGRGSSNAVASFYWDIHSYNVNTYDTIIRITTTGNNNQGIVALIEEI